MPDLTPFPRDNTSQYLVKLAHVGTRVGTLETHEHTYAELVVALGGHAVNVIDGERTEVGAGDVYVLLPGMLHEQRDMRGYRYCIFKFDYEALQHEAGELKKLPGFHLLFSLSGELRPRLDDDARRVVEILAGYLEEELRERPAGYETVAKDIFIGLVALLSRHCKVSDPRGKPGAQAVADTMGYLQRHYMENISLDELAGRVGYSRRHFTRLFREAAGVSVHEYLTRIRLTAAAELPELPLSEVAARTGFSDASALCRAYRKRFGVTLRGRTSEK